MIGRFLLVLGVIVMVVEVLVNLYNIVHLATIHAMGLNWAANIAVLFGSLFQGGALIGLGRIIELLERKR